MCVVVKGPIDHMNQDMMITWSIDMDVSCFKTRFVRCAIMVAQAVTYGHGRSMACGSACLVFIVTVFKRFFIVIYMF